VQGKTKKGSKKDPPPPGHYGQNQSTGANRGFGGKGGPAEGVEGTISKAWPRIGPCNDNQGIGKGGSEASGLLILLARGQKGGLRDLLRTKKERSRDLLHPNIRVFMTMGILRRNKNRGEKKKR